MSKKYEIQKLKREISLDNSLPFAKSAKNLVFGEGNLNPKIYFLGEAPGRMEDELGRPFVGRSGRLLRKKLIQNGLKENQVYITSVIRFRPPKNKTPSMQQVAEYEKYIDREIQIIEPKVMATLGAIALKKFTSKAISKIHGKPKKIQWKGLELTLFPLFHPAAALRNPKILHKFSLDFSKLGELVKSTAKFAKTK